MEPNTSDLVTALEKLDPNNPDAGADGCLAGGDPPFIVHGSGQPGETRPCSGHIDPLNESTDGVNMDLGINELEILFSAPVFSIGGAPLGPSDFVVTETGVAGPPTVMAVDATNNPLVVVTLSRVLTLQEWTTVRAVVENTAGLAIDNQGDLGPATNEPDRVDVGFLPTDTNNDSMTSPFDLLRFRQIVNNVVVPDCGTDEDFIDSDRSGAFSPFDLLRFRQGFNGVSPATRAWGGESMNNLRP